MSLNAQVGIALYLEKASICKQSNGKFGLNDSHKKPIITDADTIFTISDVFYYIIKNGKHGIYFMSVSRVSPLNTTI